MIKSSYKFIILIFIFTFFVKLNVVKADENDAYWESEGKGSPASFSACGPTYNGCLGIYGWQFTILISDKTKKVEKPKKDKIKDDDI